MSNANIVNILIGNIKEDKMLLNVLEARIEEAKNEKRDILSRLKDYQKDITVLLKYADNGKKKELEALGYDFSGTERGMNPVASITFEIITKAKGNQLTNDKLYDAYVKSLKNKNEAVNYTEFNIKCRTLFNTQRLLRKKGKDPKSSREDMISLNSRLAVTKEAAQEKTKDN